MDPQRHVVVLDCNIYLDVARVVGGPFTWAKFVALVAQMAKEPVPSPRGPAFDSVRVVALCMSGRFAGDEPLEVWTNAHIDRMVRAKASDPTEGVELPGLGWSIEDSEELVDLLIGGVIDASSGGSLGSEGFPDGDPPLDHEDGLVFGACRLLAGDDPLSNVYCVTWDMSFLQAHRDGRLPAHSRVVNASQMAAAIRIARKGFGISSMPKPTAVS